MVGRDKLLYVLACGLFFATGAYVWKVKNTGLSASLAKDFAPAAGTDQALLAHGAHSVVLVEVGDDKITGEDVEWEYRLVTQVLEDKEVLTPIPDLGQRLHQELAPLKRRIISDMIERKLLYRYVQLDKQWQHDDPARFTSCMEELVATLRDNPSLGQDKETKARLRSRLCERSVVDQYLTEQVYAGVKVDEAEVVEYYKNHVSEFRLPERVEIRQILLGSEGDARRVRNQVNGQNFEQMAREHSIAPEAEEGGRLGPFSKATLPSVFEVAFHMRKGEISDILKSPYGYHVIMLLAKHPRVDLGLDQARPRIEELLRSQKRGDEYQRWVEKALASIHVTTPKPLW